MTNPMISPCPESEVSSAMSASMNELKKLLNTPLTDETKISFIKEKVAAGHYRIQSQFLADKLMLEMA